MATGATLLARKSVRLQINCFQMLCVYQPDSLMEKTRLNIHQICAMATNIAEERIYLIEAPYPKAKDYIQHYQNDFMP